MRSTVALGPGIEIRFHQESEIVETLNGVRKPNKNWHYIDANNHAHVWQDDELPTLYEKVTGKIWVGDEWDGEEVSVTEWRCKICDEVVEPQYIRVMEPIHVKGPPMYTLAIHHGLTMAEYPIPADDVQPLIEILQRIFKR